MTKKTFLVAGVVAGLGILAALAFTLIPTVPTNAHDVSLIDREIEVVMGEFFYTVDGVKNGTVTLKVGETTAINFVNEGAVIHDAHFGSDVDLEGRLYKNNIVAPFDMLVLDKEQKAQITFTPTEEGTFEMGCLQLGHYEGGMKVPFVIEK